MLKQLIEKLCCKHEWEKDDMLDDMWGLICNVNGGFLEKEKPEWYEAFLRIRKEYFALLNAVKLRK